MNTVAALLLALALGGCVIAPPDYYEQSHAGPYYTPYGGPYAYQHPGYYRGGW